MPTTKPPAKKSPRKQTKTAFVLSFPTSLPAADVVAKAKEAGVVVNDKAVWAIRSEARNKKKKKGAKAAPAKPAAAAAAPKLIHHAVNGRAAEDLLRAVAAELGLTHAMAILQAEHNRVHRLLRG